MKRFSLVDLRSRFQIKTAETAQGAYADSELWPRSAFAVSASAGLLPSVPPKVLELCRGELGVSHS